MVKVFRTGFLAAAIAAAAVTSAAAGELKLAIANGRVTLIAQNVPVREILTEWARIGQTRIINAEKLTGAPVTLQLIDVPERQALDLVLHAASGYVAAPRPAGAVGASQFDRILILATSRPPSVSASASVPTFNRAMAPPPQPAPADDDDDGEPEDQGPVVPPQGVMPPGMRPPVALAPGVTMAPQPNPGVVQQPAQPTSTTAPRPGMPTAPPPGTPGNPYQPIQPPIVTKPGGGGGQ
jgi:hypothetical protein